MHFFLINLLIYINIHYILLPDLKSHRCHNMQEYLPILTETPQIIIYFEIVIIIIFN